MINMPRKGYKSITLKDSDYDYWHKKWEEQKERLRVELGITSFAGYINYLLSLASEIIEKKHNR